MTSEVFRSRNQLSAFCALRWGRLVFSLVRSVRRSSSSCFCWLVQRLMGKSVSVWIQDGWTGVSCGHHVKTMSFCFETSFTRHSYVYLCCERQNLVLRLEKPALHLSCILTVFGLASLLYSRFNQDTANLLVFVFQLCLGFYSNCVLSFVENNFKRFITLLV